MILAWPILAYLGIAMARHMKPAMPNGGWFQVHRVLVLTSLFFTCVAFLLIFIAFRNNETPGLITLGDMVSTFVCVVCVCVVCACVCCMCMCVSVCACVCVYVCICVYIMYLYMHVYMCVHIRVYFYISQLRSFQIEFYCYRMD